ncbi:hypothetical protein RRG08_066033 [Elysia crispata]|uniref:Uncharacterized protein n=1 Tax=Elysia crispata TaxID=231223 RepID=A0AAE0Y2Q1_9GAST|nr:hypothetical protein RRG08_066033 [Elysia crispata]
MVLVSCTKEGLQSLVSAAKIECEKAGLGMNGKKTKTMVVSKQEGDNTKADIQIDKETLEQGVVRAQLSEIGQSEREVWRQISSQPWTQDGNEID